MCRVCTKGGAYYIHRIVLGEKLTDIPAIWNAPMTTVADRRDSVRQLIDRIVVDAQGASEHVQLAF